MEEVTGVVIGLVIGIIVAVLVMGSVLDNPNIPDTALSEMMRSKKPLSMNAVSSSGELIGVLTWEPANDK